MIKQIDHLAIVVTDLERSRKFFEILGFQEAICSTLDAAFLESVTSIRGGSRFACGDEASDESTRHRTSALQQSETPVGSGLRLSESYRFPSSRFFG